MALFPANSAGASNTTVSVTYTGTDNTSHTETVYFYKYGDVKCCFIRLPKYPKSKVNAVFDIPSGYEPSKPVYAMGSAEDDSPRACSLQSGKFAVYVTSVNDGGIYATATYL